MATDAHEVLDEVARFGGIAVHTGPAANGTLRCAAAMGSAQVVLNVQADQPLLDPAHVRALAERMQTAELGTVVTPWEGDPEERARVKAVLDGDRAVDFYRGPLPTPRWRHLGLYGFSRAMLQRVASLPVGQRAREQGLEQLTWLDAGLPIHVVRVERAATAVDTPEQLARLRARLPR